MPRYHGRPNSVGFKASDAELDHYERAMHAEGFRGSLASWIRKTLNRRAIDTLNVHMQDIYIGEDTWKPVPNTGRPRKYQVNIRVDGSPIEKDPRAFQKKQKVIDLDRD